MIVPVSTQVIPSVIPLVPTNTAPALVSGSSSFSQQPTNTAPLQHRYQPAGPAWPACQFGEDEQTNLISHIDLL